ncbi:MAG: YHYH domain-containing protein, partial [Cyanobacteria bacterium J06555_13]
MLVLSGELAHAHSGRTNNSGCHNNRRTGEYHCHNSGSNPTRTNPQSSPAPVPSSNPTVWTILSIGDGDTLRVFQGNETETTPVRDTCKNAHIRLKSLV